MISHLNSMGYQGGFDMGDEKVDVKEATNRQNKFWVH